MQRPVPAHPLVVLRPEAGRGPGQPCAKRRPALRLQPARPGTAKPRPSQASKQARARRSPTLPARKPPGLTRPAARFPEAAPEETRRHRPGPLTGNEREMNMSGFRNVAQIIGNLGRDPEVRSTQNGKVVSLSIATSESWKDKHTGERKERTEWHRVVLFNPGLCDLAEKYLVKGSKVFVEGQLKTRKWTDSDGVERYSTEIHLSAYNGTLTFLDSKRDTEGRSSSRDAWAGGGGSIGADLDEDIPFGPC